MIIKNREHFNYLIDSFRRDWASALHVLCDFDRALTYGVVDGVKTPSLISLLRDGKHLSSDYQGRAVELFNRYYPVEIDPQLSLQEKKPIMAQWWHEHFSLMIECWLKKSDIHDIIQKSHLKLRDHVDVTLQLLRNNAVPFIIISAGAIGEAIPLFLSWQWIDFPNISYICNHFNWDISGNAVSIREPIIHVCNKDETSIKTMPGIYEKIKDRKNIIVIGDSLGDSDMAHGFDHKNLIKIGFLDSEDLEQKQQFIETFDVVIEGSGDFSFVKDCLGTILQ